MTTIEQEIGVRLEIILTWSGQHSHNIALFFRDWLKEVIPGVKPWVSSEDIQKGKKWFQELMAQFERTRVSITCITPENVHSPWVYYEVGMIAAKQDPDNEGVICPYLVAVDGKLIHSTPLAQYQYTEADKEDTWGLVQSINRELGERGHNQDLLKSNFDSKWPKLKRQIDKIKDEIGEEVEEVTTVHQIHSPHTLRENAKKLLCEAAQNQTGTILCIFTFEGMMLGVNDKNLVQQPQNPREQAGWKAALEELQSHNYIRDQGGKGEIFELTEDGYAAADLLDPLNKLTDEAKQILMSAAKPASNGNVFCTKSDVGDLIWTPERQFNKGTDSRESAAWKHGFGQLESQEFILRSSRGSNYPYEVTKKGYEVADQLANRSHESKLPPQ